MSSASNRLVDHIDNVQAKDPSDVLGATGSPSTTLEITFDILEQSKLDRALGRMVYVKVHEDGRDVLVIGQVVSVETRNRWHEDPAFKGVIKRYGRLPHLSEAADNRIATISVQAAYDLSLPNPEGYTLSTSPSTGERVGVMDNETLRLLVQQYGESITYLGHFYNTKLHAPFWFKHFGDDDKVHNEAGAGDAYHIGVFGKTGSGKSNTAAAMLLGYARNSHNMNILVLDPQDQFYKDNGLIPGGGSFEESVTKYGMKYKKYNILRDVYLDDTDFKLFAELLRISGFVRRAFGIKTEEKQDLAEEQIVRWLNRKSRESDDFNLNTYSPERLLRALIQDFMDWNPESKTGKDYIKNIYDTKSTQVKTLTALTDLAQNFNGRENVETIASWSVAHAPFRKQKSDGTVKMHIDEIANRLVGEEVGNMVVLSLYHENPERLPENFQALFVKEIETRLVKAGADLYGTRTANCLIVLDEAHRFISYDTPDERVRLLTKETIDAVRTTRKYGIGYMFITQTISSLDEEILKQMRVFAFGYGLTTGDELRKIQNIINDESAIKLYKNFIDPSSNHKYPFMFFGPISPLSFTGSPLFVDMYTGGGGSPV